MEFNSLEAQREACEAYIISQRGEGWILVPDRYNDGGVSGGTLDRPALKRLLIDVEAGRIDIVVVYKVDRLSRSLLGFHKLIEMFERRKTTFVSITQSFNTPIRQHLDDEIDYFSECARTADFKEGVTAFVEKRKPDFKGH